MICIIYRYSLHSRHNIIGHEHGADELAGELLFCWAGLYLLRRLALFADDMFPN